MNSSSGFGFGGDLCSGFPKSTPNNPNFSFNSPSIQRSSGGLPRPKPAKSKKQSNSHNSKSSGKLENRTGSGFNLLRHPSLSGGSDLGGNLFSKLTNDITKVNIENYGSKGDWSNNNDDNVGSFIGIGVETEKLRYEFQSKLNITGNDVDDGAKKDFVFRAGKGNNLVRSVSDSLSDGVKNLNIKGFDDNSTKESCESSGHLGLKRDKVLSAGSEMKLNMGSTMGDSTGQTDGGFTFQAATTKAHMDKPKTDIRPGGATASTIFSSNTLPFQTGSNTFGMTSDKPGNKDEFCFTTKKDATETPFVEFKTPNSQSNRAFGLNKNLEFGAKREVGTSTNVKKKKGKSKQPKPVQLWHGPDFVSSKTSARCSREHSVTSEESFSLDNKDDFSDTQSAVTRNAIYGDLVATAQYMNIKDGRVKDELKEEGSGNVFDGIAAEATQDHVHGSKTEIFAVAAEDINHNSDIALRSAETEVSSRTSIDRQDSDGQMFFSSPSNLEHISGFDFTFAACPSDKSQHPPPSRHHKKKEFG